MSKPSMFRVVTFLGGLTVGVALVRVPSLILALPVVSLLLWGLVGSRPLVLVGIVGLRTVTDWSPLRNQLASVVSDLNGLIAVCLIALAIGRLAVHRVPGVTRRALAVAVVIFIGLAVGLRRYGPEDTLLREAVRELSLLAVFILPFTYRVGVERNYGQRLLAVVLPVGVGTIIEAGLTGRRATSTFSHPNSAALAFAVMALMCLWFFRGRLRLVTTGVFGAALLATGSMAGAAALGAGLYGFLGAGRPRSGRIGALAGVVVVALLFAVSPIGGNRLEELTTTVSFNAAAEGFTTNSLDWRFYNWGMLAGTWTDSPILGFGLGSTLEFVQPGKNLPHNEYLRYLVELGALGLALAILAIRWLIGGVSKVRLHNKRAEDTAPILRGLSCLLLVNCLAANTFLYTSAMYLALVLAGLTIEGGSAIRTGQPREQLAEAMNENVEHPV